MADKRADRADESALVADKCADQADKRDFGADERAQVADKPPNQADAHGLVADKHSRGRDKPPHAADHRAERAVDTEVALAPVLYCFDVAVVGRDPFGFFLERESPRWVHWRG